MRYTVTTLALVCVFTLRASCTLASTSVAIPIAQQGTVESDGDGVFDIFDNAPGADNADQIDTDADQIGDVIDPTPFNSNPNLGDPGLGVFDSPSIAPGGTASFSYVLLTTPPGGWGRILLDFDLNNSVDAVAFGALDTNINSVFIPASLYTSANWNLNAPGTYTVGMKAFAPGMSSDNWAFPSVIVVPEPTTACLIALFALATIGGPVRNRRR
jgi:hypothetical protein